MFPLQKGKLHSFRSGSSGVNCQINHCFILCLSTVDGETAIELIMVGETDTDLKIGIHKQIAYDAKVVKAFLKKKKWHSTWLAYIRSVL